jgi:hypothetical protein
MKVGRIPLMAEVAASCCVAPTAAVSPQSLSGVRHWNHCLAGPSR